LHEMTLLVWLQMSLLKSSQGTTLSENLIERRDTRGHGRRSWQ